MEGRFNEEDYQKVVEFLNFVAKKAKFEVDTSEIIKYFGLLSHMQKHVVPKIENHILEVKEVIENEDKGE